MDTLATRPIELRAAAVYDYGDMKCPEKEDLQLKCVNACNDFEAATEQLKATGMSFDYRSKTAIWKPTPIPIQDQTGFFSAFPVAYGNYLKASSALSKHLSTHRC
jgi:hypothetical protein